MLGSEEVSTLGAGPYILGHSRAGVAMHHVPMHSVFHLAVAAAVFLLQQTFFDARARIHLVDSVEKVLHFLSVQHVNFLRHTLSPA